MISLCLRLWEVVAAFVIIITIHVTSLTTAEEKAIDNDDHPLLIDNNFYYRLDGSSNNIENPTWGAAGSPRIRHLPNFSASNDPLTNENLPSARRIMEDLFRRQTIPSSSSHRDTTTIKSSSTNHLMLEFGHFIAQDIIGTSQKNLTEYYPIPCGQLMDWVFCPVTGKHYTTPPTHLTDNNNIISSSSTTPSFIDFWRTQHTLITNSSKRASLNVQSSFLDMSNLYGTSPEEMAETRAYHGGLLKLDDKTGLGPPAPLPSAKFNALSPGAYSLRITFMRYHNLLAEEIAKTHQSHPATEEATDEELYQMARRRNIAIYQSIVEEKYIPTLLGQPLDPYVEYRPKADPRIDEFFAAVAFRYAHSSFSNLIRLVGPTWEPIDPNDPLLLRDIIETKDTNTDIANSNNNNQHHLIQEEVLRQGGGIEGFLRGLVVEPSRKVDASFVDDFNLWSKASSVLDIQRGRDVQIPPYNQVRVAMGLTPLLSLEELTTDDAILAALRSLYDNDIDTVDAYVGALIEKPSRGCFMGPLFCRSIKDQFTRLRDGDRFWYKNVYSLDEYNDFPSLSEIIRQIGFESSTEDFPEDAFLTYKPKQYNSNEGTCNDSQDSKTQLSLLSGELTLGWSVDMPSRFEQRMDPLATPSIDVTLTATSPMNGPGYLGVGWRSQKMKGAEFWFCTIDEDEFALLSDLPSSCSSDYDAAAAARANTTMFSCCVAETHPSRCHDANDIVFYHLEIIDWCLTEDVSSVTVRAPVCRTKSEEVEGTVPSTSGQSQEDPSVNDRIRCFRLTSTEDNRMNFIVAYNPNEVANHGYMRRTAAQVDLYAGTLTQSEIGTADDGLIATHGIFMLVGWMLVAPIAIFIVRYMKTSSWRVGAHVSLMGFTGSLMVPLLVGVEASVGASDKSQQHAVVGLTLMVVYFFMAFAGRIRYLKLSGRKVGKKADFLSLLLHKCGGYAIIGAAWYNCYTGLVRIGPEDSYVQVVLGSTFPLGYNLPAFGFIQQYLFFPYIAVVCATFVVAEIRRRRMNGSSHANEMQAILKGKSSIWNDLRPENLETMTMENFLEMTRMGTALCIVDGYVLDITDFTDAHPGGQHLLRYAKGSDITEEFIGLRDVDGHKNVHSHAALQLLKSFIKAVLVGDNCHTARESMAMLANKDQKKIADTEPSNHCTRGVMSVFRSGCIKALECLTPEIDMTSDCKPVILLRLALPSARLDEHQKWLTTLPSSCFTFRSVCGKTGNAVERQYTPVKLDRGPLPAGASPKPNSHELTFIISLVPGGKMSGVFLDMRKGKSILVKGPTVNPRIVQTFDDIEWESVVMIAAGTGISPMLQVIEFYLSRLSKDSRGDSPRTRLYLLWIVKSQEYDFGKSLGLQQQVERSEGMFSYTVVYSSDDAGAEPSNTIPDPRDRRRNTWNFESLARKSARRLSWNFNPDEKVKQLVVRPSLKRASSRTLSMSKLAVVTKVDPQPVAHTDQAFNSETWMGPTQYRTRSFNQGLLSELFASIDAASGGINGVQVDLPQEDVSGHEEGHGSQLDDDEIGAKENSSDPSEGCSDKDEGKDGNDEREVQFKRLVAISGTPTFEYETRMMLVGLGHSRDKIMTFHGSSEVSLPPPPPPPARREPTPTSLTPSMDEPQGLLPGAAEVVSA